MMYLVQLLTISFIIASALINNAKTLSVICYYATWAITRPDDAAFVPEDLNPNHCTHINYAFLGLNPDGTLQILEEYVDIDLDGFNRVSALKETNPTLKVLFSIGGATADTATFTSIAADPTKRAALAQSAIDFLQTYNFDGLDVDWEYPLEGDRETFITLLQELKDAFTPYGYLLTVAVASLPTDAAYDVPAMSNILDVINVMTYDFHSSWTGTTMHHSPLYAHPSEGDWQKDNQNTNSSITHWIENGAAPQKLTLGIGFYGHAYTLTDPNQHDVGSPASGPADPGDFTQNSGTLGYSELCYFHGDGVTVWEDTQKVPYLYDGSLWIGYDNEESVAIKVQYAKDNNLAGVMIWSIDTDDNTAKCGTKNGLLEAINNAL